MMSEVDTQRAAVGFLRLLCDASECVADPWFLLRVAATDAAEAVTRYRERVYCYELYHQIRTLSSQGGGAMAGAPTYMLSGEIDKAGLNAVIDGGRSKPDLVWHVPGKSRNAVVVEVKAVDHLRPDLIRKDLKSLNAFLRAPRGYLCGVLLVYGSTDSEVLRGRILGAADQINLPRESRQRTRLLWHPQARHRIEDLGVLLV